MTTSHVRSDELANADDAAAAAAAAVPDDHPTEPIRSPVASAEDSELEDVRVDDDGGGGEIGSAAAARGRRMMLRRRHRFQTDSAVLFAAIAIASLAGLSAWCHLGGGGGAGASVSEDRRYLEDGGGGDAADGGDYSKYSCDLIFSLTEPYSSDRCSYAQSCNGGEGLYIHFVFCNASHGVYTWCLILSPLLALWLVTLFRMLGTTAEDYFSPSLEMFSLKMGLPPRFAGVTLLALGNGAADVSATISAFAMDPDKGYRMSLGALTGAGVFVGTVVAGVVIVVAGGVPCRGALVRDVVAFVVTTAVVYGILKEGTVGSRAITSFFAMYFAFIAIVLIADVYHRAVVLPRLAGRAERAERQRQEREGRTAAEAAMDRIAEITDDAFEEEGGGGEGDGAGGGAGTEMRLDVPADDRRSSLGSGGAGSALHRQPSIRIISSDDSADEEVVPIRNKALNAVLMALSNYDRHEGRGEASPASEGWGVTQPEEGERPVVLHGKDGILNRHHGHHRVDGEGGGGAAAAEMGAYEGGPMGLGDQACESPYAALIDNVCAEEGSAAHGASSWRGAWHDGREELRVHCLEVWDDIADNEENNALDKFLLVCELPFTVLRKLSVPIPCEGYYCRAVVALSTAASPLWIGTYFLVQHETNLFWGGFPFVLALMIVSSIVGALIMRYAPGGDRGNMNLALSGPIAFYGFIIAATWIDAIADQLVGLLGFLGAVCRIPGSIMGLTVLAWGNSMGDLSANMTMARKGLANMAITACFAGPLFNVLIGLGGGFMALRGITGEAEKEVSLTPPIEAGFAFLLCNCILVLVSGVCVCRGRIPAGYGYAALALYTVYVVTSLVLQFSG